MGWEDAHEIRRMGRHHLWTNPYRISSYKTRRYLILQHFIQRSQHIRPKVLLHKYAGIIRMWVLYKGGFYEEIQ